MMVEEGVIPSISKVLSEVEFKRLSGETGGLQRVKRHLLLPLSL